MYFFFWWVLRSSCGKGWVLIKKKLIKKNFQCPIPRFSRAKPRLLPIENQLDCRSFFEFGTYLNVSLVSTHDLLR